MAGGRIDVEVAADLGPFNEEFESGLESAGEAASSFAGKLAGVAAVAGVAISFQSVIDTGVEFTRTLNEMSGVSQATGAQMDAVKKKAMELGNDIELSGTSANDAAAAMTELSKGGLSVEQSMDAAKGSLALAAAAQIEAAEASEIQSQALNTFGLEAKDATLVADTLANVSNAASGEITDFAMGLSQSGLVAHSLGISLQDTSTALGLFANNGMAGSDAGTSLKTMLVSLASPSKVQAGALEDLGISAFDAAGNFVGLRTITEQLADAQQNMTQEQFASAAATAFGTDAVRAASAMASEGAGNWDTMAESVGRAGGALELAGAQNQGLPGVFERAGNASERFQLQLFELIDGPLTSFGNTVVGIADGAMDQFAIALDNSGGVLVGMNEVIGGSLTNLPMLEGAFNNVVSTGRSLAEMGVSVGNGLKSIAEGAMESGSVVDTLQGTLSLTTGVVSTTFNAIQPLVSVVATAAGAFGALPGPIQSVAVGLVALKVASMATSAFMARSTDGMGRMATAAHGLGTRIQGLPGTVRTLGTSLQTAGGNFRAFTTLSGQAGAGVGRFAGSMQVLATGQGSLSRIGQSFVTASTGAQRFGTAIGTLAAAGTGLKTMGGNLLSAVGGPWMIGIGAAIAALSIYSANQRKAAEHNRMLKQSAEELGKALYESNGALNATTQRAAANALESSKLAGTGRSLVEYLEAVGVSGGVAAKGLAGSRSEMQATLKVLEDQARIEAEVNKQRVGKGSEGFASSALGSLFNIGGAKDKANEAANALADFKKLDEEARKLAESQRRLDLSAGFIDASGTATALGTMSSTMRAFGESTGGAASKIDILNGGLAKLRGDQLSTKDAQQAINDAMRGFGEAAREAGTGVVDAAGNIDTSTAAGSRLYSELKNVMSGFDGVANAAYQSAIQQGKSHEDAAAAAEAASQREIDALQQTLLNLGWSEQAVAALITQFNLIPPSKSTYIDVDDTDARAKLGYFQTTLDNLKGVQLTVPTPAFSAPLPFGVFGAAERALGGPIEGGIPGKDSVPILGMPGEHVLTTTDVDNLGGQAGVYRFREALSQGKVGKFADGGAIGSDGLDNMINFARAKAGIGYNYGPWDCSMYMSHIAATGMGQQPRRLWTTYSILGGDLQGMQPGGSEGHFRIGVSQEHMAGTLFMKDGSRVDVENGGSNAGSTFGGSAAGYDDAQFSRQFFLPDTMLNPAVQMALSGGASYTAGASTNPWTEKDALALESARVAIVQAQEDRDAVYANDKKSDADRQQADLKVQRAELKVKELEQKRDGAGSATSIAPAPALTGAMTEDAIGIRNAEISVLDAQLSRDKTYADATSTSLDKEKADIAVYTAQNRLEQARKDAKEAKDGKTFSLNDRFKQFGSDVGGIVAGAILEQFPSQVTESHWMTTDWEGLMGKKPESTPAASPTFSTAEIQGQLPTTPGVPGWQNMLAQVGDDWQKRLAEALNVPTVLRDNGGPVPHGTAALNLSGAEEWMLTADERLNLSRDFALMRGASQGGDGSSADISALTAQVDRLMKVADKPTSVYNFTTRDVEENARRIRQIENTRALGAGSRF
ncbi:phage tail tape measure protein [Rhodococcus sp. WS1]|uniref:phage tail tape measure protein n=1 Tax=unclassified Rhodococcus (in: high G+C Gram-positive bacteria) TaxID=192944 RepID=UPI0011442983|nr:MULTISPECIES: phage tail tape measure protein [unclassified Rhodococcus (in: high G+C Gram-positive bacteria)]ROZ53516.1 phage tail tape measure protein [Rhodococcus sp. WS1]TQC36777.1 phage tail tape measure protein [Rhodococcus sp. WS7]